MDLSSKFTSPLWGQIKATSSGRGSLLGVLGDRSEYRNIAVLLKKN
jgi:hypothetical protein